MKPTQSQSDEAVPPTTPLSRIDSYDDAVAYLFAEARFSERNLKYESLDASLRTFRESLQALGNPQDRFRTIHITGTKGKGSTSAFTEAILREAGLRTGLFTSPHLHSFRERIRVDGEMISREGLVDLVRRLQPHFEAHPAISVFDRITTLAFQFFAEQGVAWGVIEVGLGGRLDSTNVIRPQVCGITRISMDHVHILGGTLAEIAREKAGIIKPGIPVYAAPQKAPARQVLQAVSAAQEAPLHWVRRLSQVPLSLIGAHQQVNAAIARGLVLALAEAGQISLREGSVEKGLASTVWPGRFELLPAPSEQSPPLLVDCAHNVDSINILLQALATHFPSRSVTIIFGANRQKPLLPMLRRLRKLSQRFVLVSSHHPKALRPEELWRQVQPLREDDDPDLVFERPATMDEALERALALTPASGLLVGTGSVYVVAELREAWNRRYPDTMSSSDWAHQAAGEPLIMANIPTASDKT